MESYRPVFCVPRIDKGCPTAVCGNLSSAGSGVRDDGLLRWGRGVRGY